MAAPENSTSHNLKWSDPTTIMSSAALVVAIGGSVYNHQTKVTSLDFEKFKEECNENSKSIQAKFDEIVEFCKILQKNVVNLMSENQQLQRQLESVTEQFYSASAMPFPSSDLACSPGASTDAHIDFMMNERQSNPPRVHTQVHPPTRARSQERPSTHNSTMVSQPNRSHHPSHFPHPAHPSRPFTTKPGTVLDPSSPQSCHDNDEEISDEMLTKQFASCFE